MPKTIIALMFAGVTLVRIITINMLTQEQEHVCKQREQREVVKNPGIGLAILTRSYRPLLIDSYTGTVNTCIERE